jgi:hypothetical protein
VSTARLAAPSSSSAGFARIQSSAGFAWKPRVVQTDPASRELRRRSPPRLKLATTVDQLDVFSPDAFSAAAQGSAVRAGHCWRQRLTVAS